MRRKPYGMQAPIAFAVTCGLIGAAAVGLASFVYFGDYDQNGAALTLFGTAGVLGLLRRGVTEARRD